MSPIGKGKEGVMKISRRDYLKYVGGAAAGIALGSVTGYYSGAAGGRVSATTRTLTETQATTEIMNRTAVETMTKTESWSASLRVAAEIRGLLVGAAARVEGLPDERYSDTLAREFNFLTPEMAMKWAEIHPTPDVWNFGPADALVEFASDHGMKIKGHTLIWHALLPDYVNQQMSANELSAAMEEHIHMVVGHYRGRVSAWDVVNEAVDDHAGLRDSLFLDKLGDGYVAEAFQLAHEADPDALLIYNDYGAEGLGGKSDGVYALAKKLVTDDVPIDGVGLQMHVLATHYPNPNDIAANVRRLASLGLKVNISEMDVGIRDASGSLPDRLQLQRRVYHDVIDACCRETNFMGVTFWGFTDALSYDPAEEGLVFDESYAPKPAYWGILEALLRSP